MCFPYWQKTTKNQGATADVTRRSPLLALLLTLCTWARIFVGRKNDTWVWSLSTGYWIGSGRILEWYMAVLGL
jgi:hypothetical protein